MIAEIFAGICSCKELDEIRSKTFVEHCRQ